MKILLAAKYIPSMNPRGGVQSWIKTVAAELERMGHDVTQWCPQSAALSGRFDLGIIANTGRTRTAAFACDSVLNVSHGIINEERPYQAFSCAFTSEGVRSHWLSERMGYDGPIIRQPIDLDFWKPLNGVDRFGIIRYSYRSGLDWLENVSDDLGHQYYHMKNVTHEQARHNMQRAACVLATGRAALEAMACGAPTVFVDHRSAYQDALADLFIDRQMKNNYSGRGGVVPTHENMREMILSAIRVGSMRQTVGHYHDVKMIVQKLLK